ncbi:MAG: HPP family protein [Alkaliphilus sp.]|nr:HPP family protein [Alkaliphilus sp.]
MHIFDEKFLKNKKQYLIQSLIAAIIFIFMMTLLDIFLNATVIVSLAATTFVIFTIPLKEGSKPRYIIGGHSIAILVGSCFYFMSSYFTEINLSIFAGLAVGFTIFLMVIFNFEHPPATAFALGLVLGGVTLYKIAIVVIGLSTILLLKRALKKHLIDLL